MNSKGLSTMKEWKEEDDKRRVDRERRVENARSLIEWVMSCPVALARLARPVQKK